MSAAELLADARCVNCAGPVDAHGHRGLWVPDLGPPVPHYVCAGCFALASRSRAALEERATRVALALCRAGGRA
jgi:hypothetical protein